MWCLHALHITDTDIQVALDSCVDPRLHKKKTHLGAVLWQGKSTLANYLLGRERSITGPEPGLTRDAVHGRLQFGERSIDLVDTAGWMRRNRLHNYDECG